MTNNKGQFYNEQTGAFANQTITIMQRVAGDQYREAYVAACQLLSPPALKMYGYACLDAEGYKRVWKRQDFETIGLTSSAYYRGLQELKELGYIDNGVFNPGAGIEKSKTDTIPKNGNVPKNGKGFPKNGKGSYIKNRGFSQKWERFSQKWERPFPKMSRVKKRIEKNYIRYAAQTPFPKMGKARTFPKMGTVIVFPKMGTAFPKNGNGKEETWRIYM